MALSRARRTVNEIPVRETLPHRGGVYGASDLGVYDLHGGEYRDLRLLDTERVRERCGVFRDLDLRFQIRINVYGAVGDDEEPILLGDLENGCLAEQIAIFLQAFSLSRMAFMKVEVCISPSWAYPLRRSERARRPCLRRRGRPSSSMMRKSPASFPILSSTRTISFRRPIRMASAMPRLHGHHQRAESIGVMRRGECHALFFRTAPGQTAPSGQSFSAS